LVKENEQRFQRQSLLLKNAQQSADQLAPSLPWTKNNRLLREKIPRLAWKKSAQNKLFDAGDHVDTTFASIDITNYSESNSSDNSLVIVPPKASKLYLIQIQEEHKETS
jgi:hypothetical protein